ncbi:VWA domain-containing protein [Sulfurimonas sp.]|nr:VWA domain-containing protein [Sulfurimonas sp.]
MSFLHPEFLYYMIVPMLILFTLLLTQKEPTKHFFNEEVMKKLMVSSGSLSLRFRNTLFLIIGLLMIVALAEPVIKDGVVKIKAKSADIMIALDISDSMLAEDVYPNRLELAKQKALTLLDESPNERIGVVAFAKNSYLVSPLSFDSSAVAFLLKQLDTSSITEKGTDFLSVLNVVSKAQAKKEKKYLLILSDGGDKNDFSAEIEMAKDEGIKVFILGVGTKKGAPIKLSDGSFIKHKGDIIVSKLNKAIVDLATKTGGVYIQSTTSSEDIKTMFREITRLSDEKELKSEEIPRYTQLFYYPLGFALFLLLFALSSFRKKSSHTLAITLLLVSFSELHVEASMLDFLDLSKAKEAYENGNYEESANLYKSYANDTSSAEANYNTGNSYYKQEKYDEALEAYTKANFSSAEHRARNFSNIGNTHVKNAKEDSLQKAVEAYEESLKLKEDKETRENLEEVKKLIEKQKEDSKDDKDQDKNKKDDKENQDSKDNKDSQDKKQSEKSEDEKKDSDNKKENQDQDNSSKK